MNEQLKKYLTDLIVEHGVTDLSGDSLGDRELGEICNFVYIQDDLNNDADYIKLMDNTNCFSCDPASHFDKVKKLARNIVTDLIGDLFYDLVNASKPEDNSHEDAPRAPERTTTLMQDFWSINQ